MVMNMDWIYYEPRSSERYSIRVFDDGNERYAGYVNVWHKYGEWRGKVALVNSVDRAVRIESISAWKLDSRGGSPCYKGSRANGADAGGG
jgi:hypothetical protein